MSGLNLHQPRLDDNALRRALRPGPDVVAPATFGLAVGRAIAGRPQRRRPWPGVPASWPRELGLVVQLVLVVALLLALIVGALLAGAVRTRPFGGGPLFLSRSMELSVIDSDAGVARPVLHDPRGIFGVARSTDGGLVSFWTGVAGRPDTALELVRADGSDRRVLAADVSPGPVGRGSIDVWSADNRYLATAVSAGGVHRILVVEVASGKGHLIGPDEGADSPLWSPDGAWLAFTHEHRGGQNTLAIMRPDGLELREFGAGPAANVSGPVNWSSDGRWIYFDAGTTAHDLYRLDVATGRAQRLTESGTAAAPALSPDDRWVAYLLLPGRGTVATDSVWIMTPDGSDPRLLVESANLRGWSADGQYVLVVEQPTGGPTTLLAIAPDGSERRTLLTLETCPSPCLQDVSWGWPRP
jgi:hypothetical protein